MDENQSLQNSLNVYRGQLTAVEDALLCAADDKDLQELRDNLLEVIKLTEDSLTKGTPLCEASDEQTWLKDKTEKSEYELFQDEIAALSKDEKEESSPEPVDPDLEKCLAELEGKRCRAPHIQEWGQMAYHNALIVSTDAEGAKSIDDVDVCVMFCNPMCESMKPCTFFLEGHCRFSSDKCKFSHGYAVKLSEIQEFKEPDYTLLQRDAYCLAKYNDDLWYKAQVLECLEDNMLKVQYSQYNEDVTLKLEDVIPSDEQPVYEGSDISDGEEMNSGDDADSSSDETPQVVWLSSADVSLGDWEKYTKGIGSKLMERMGYIKGQGLGRNGEGRIQPIEAVILPQGKSLDKCMELREAKESRNTDAVEKREKRKKKLQAKAISNGYTNPVQKKTNVFDFLNKKLKENNTFKKANSQGTSYQGKLELKKSSVKSLNVQSLQVSENISKAQKELRKLQEQLERNKDRDRVMKSQLESKISSLEHILQSLRSQEKDISKEQTTRKHQRKLTVF